MSGEYRKLEQRELDELVRIQKHLFEVAQSISYVIAAREYGPDRGDDMVNSLSRLSFRVGAILV